MNKKYELDNNDTIEVEDRTLYRIKCENLIKISLYGKQQHKGYIESKKNLSMTGKCMVFDNAKVYEFGLLADDATAMDEATVKNNATISNNGVIKDDAIIKDNAEVRDNALVSCNAIIGGYASINGYAVIGKDGYIMSDDDYITIKGLGSENRYTTFYRTIDPKIIMVICGCFEGTLEEFEEAVVETHKDTKYAKEYLSIIQTVKIHFDLI